MKTIIAGTRTFQNYDSLKTRIDAYREKNEITEIISGGAKGVDSLAERYAVEHSIPFKLFPADWDKNGKAAGPMRNREMAEYSEVLLAVWDGSSKGTKNMISEMHRVKKQVYVIIYNMQIVAAAG